MQGYQKEHSKDEFLEQNRRESRANAGRTRSTVSANRFWEWGIGGRGRLTGGIGGVVFGRPRPDNNNNKNNINDEDNNEKFRNAIAEWAVSFNIPHNA